MHANYVCLMGNEGILLQPLLFSREVREHWGLFCAFGRQCALLHSSPVLPG
jgi:hypothetical protein